MKIHFAARLYRQTATLVMALLTASCSPALFNLTVPRSGYAVHQDLAYGTDTRQKLDIYVPAGDQTASRPVLLFFYGGNWQSGSKKDYLALGEAFASQGIIVAIADYRLYPKVKYPLFLNDAAHAFKFLREEVGRFGGDPKQIFVSGHSAGAYNAVMLASNPHYLQEVGETPLAIRGVIGIAGPYNFLPLSDPDLIDMFGGARQSATQPISFIDGARPPMLLATGSADETVRPQNSTSMAEKLREFGNEADVRIYEDVGHVGILLSLTRVFRGKTTLHQDMLAFMRAQKA